jgi:hypothetical protein
MNTNEDIVENVDNVDDVNSDENLVSTVILLSTYQGSSNDLVM